MDTTDDPERLRDVATQLRWDLLDERARRKSAEAALAKKRLEAQQALLGSGVVVALGFVVWFLDDENWPLARWCFAFAAVVALGGLWGAAFGGTKWGSLENLGDG